MKNKLQLSLDLRIVSLVLLIIIVVILGLWRPWQADTAAARKITVTGTGKVTAEPDQYQFNPTFTSAKGDNQAATSEVNGKVNTLTAKLKDLGVKDKDIQVQTNSYRKPIGGPQPLTNVPVEQNAFANITIKVATKDLAQKIQDYLATTGAEGQLTSSPSFSDEKQKSLLGEARDKAITDAKSRAEKTASNLGTKLGKVLEIKDSDQPYAIMDSGTIAVAPEYAKSTGSSVRSQIFSGQQDISFTVQAVFEIK